MDVDGNRLTGNGSDYFDALCLIRRELEAMDVSALCVGARKDAYPSGMARDMGAGLKVYILEMGKRAESKPVSIFEYAPPETVGTVDEQREYFERWLNSF